MFSALPTMPHLNLFNVILQLTNILFFFLCGNILILQIHVIFLKFKFNWGSCILCDTPGPGLGRGVCRSTACSVLTGSVLLDKLSR